LHGKELSYNNIFDANALLELLTEFDEPTAVAIKHGNPCGISSAKDIYTAYLNAYNADTESIFGGIVGLNREVDEKLAIKLSEIFLEIILAPSFTSKALDILQKKKNIRLLEIDKLNEFKKDNMTFKVINGGLLYQEKDNLLFNDELEVVSKRKPTPTELEDMNFAWII
ncbi:bifunctional phosphoribosylaminoimidazolecarboxamide formyltransferase/IMP cyclohydrolase, partial [Vibrio parahaemolyticus]|nr:bifunctional phosphoribosylaminoimidazolecarboxamide formyltransferase/IMP cyclohydrolase [Vibrio parahaemolyticus]